MTDADVLNEDALAGETAALPGDALAEQSLAGDAGAPRRRTWTPSILDIVVRSDQSPAMGFASPGTSRALGDSGHLEFYCYRPAAFALDVWFHVDADEIPRPKPFPPPVCRLQWRFVPDDGSAPLADLWEDRAPAYLGPGMPLGTSFSSTLRLKVQGSGTLEIAATLVDRAGTVAYSDRIRCVVTPCLDAGAPPNV